MARPHHRGCALFTRMTDEPIDPLRFPIGPWQPQETYTLANIRQLVDQIRTLPDVYALVLNNATPDDLRKQYRPGSWTVQQLVHHVADIHLLHFLRLKNALVEPGATAIMADMNGWAALPEARNAPISDSVTMLYGVHRRIAFLAGSLQPEELAVTYYHPLRARTLTISQALSMTVWHGEHHLAHIRLAMQS